MRLFRRSFFCLVVGVTAFGAVGLGFRPRASWSVDLGREFGAVFTRGEHQPSASDAIWITYPIMEERHAETVVAFRSTDGRQMTRWTGPEGDSAEEAVRMPDGRLLTVSQKEFPKDSPKAKKFGQYTEFAFLDPVADAPAVTQSFDGDWSATADARNAWTLDELKAGFRIEVADLLTGTRVVEFDCRNEYPHFKWGAYAVSPNAQWVVVCETARDPKRRPAGLDVWDVRKGVLARTVYPPKWPGPDQHRFLSLDHSVGPDRLKYMAHINERNAVGIWYDLKHDRHYDPRWVPAGPEAWLHYAMHSANNGETVWTAYSRNRLCVWCAVFDGEKPLSVWRPVRVPMTADFHPSPVLDNDTGVAFPVQNTVGVWRVPGGTSLIAHAVQSSLNENLPEALQSRVPEAWQPDDHLLRSFWNDGVRDKWIDVGMAANVETLQVRSNALIAIVALADGSYQLQSWPLPPRDPKWQALGVAALCTAATWWVCASRYRRRTRLALVGAA